MNYPVKVLPMSLHLLLPISLPYTAYPSGHHVPRPYGDLE